MFHEMPGFASSKVLHGDSFDSSRRNARDDEKSARACRSGLLHLPALWWVDPRYIYEWCPLDNNGGFQRSMSSAEPSQTFGMVSHIIPRTFSSTKYLILDNESFVLHAVLDTCPNQHSRDHVSAISRTCQITAV